MVTLRPFETVDWWVLAGAVKQGRALSDLAIRKVKELVTAMMKYNVNDNGTHLSPSEFHRILTEAPENLVLLDVSIGAFSILCVSRPNLILYCKSEIVSSMLLGISWTRRSEWHKTPTCETLRSLSTTLISGMKVFKGKKY